MRSYLTQLHSLERILSNNALDNAFNIHETVLLLLLTNNVTESKVDSDALLVSDFRDAVFVVLLHYINAVRAGLRRNKSSVVRYLVLKIAESIR